MDPRILGVLFLLAQTALNQSQPPAGGGLARAGVMGLLGAALSRPSTFARLD